MPFIWYGIFWNSSCLIVITRTLKELGRSLVAWPHTWCAEKLFNIAAAILKTDKRQTLKNCMMAAECYHVSQLFYEICDFYFWCITISFFKNLECRFQFWCTVAIEKISFLQSCSRFQNFQIDVEITSLISEGKITDSCQSLNFIPRTPFVLDHYCDWHLFLPLKYSLWLVSFMKGLHNREVPSPKFIHCS